MRRILQVTAFVLVAAVVAAITSVAVLSRTQFGRERVRRLAMGALREVVHGTLAVERIEGDLLGKFTLVGVRITDSLGATFLAADSVSLRLDFMPLLRKRVRITDVTLSRPVVMLSQNSKGAWNYQRIFPADSIASSDTTIGLGDWVRLEDVVVRDGDVTVRRPWAPDGPAAGRDSVIAAALAPDARPVIERSTDGFVQVMTFRSMRARIPQLVIADPSVSGMRIDVDSLSTIAALFRPPHLDIKQLSAVVRIEDDSTTVSALRLLLPNSRATGQVVVHNASGDIRASLDVPTLVFADVQALYPSLPAGGTARMRVALLVRDSLPSEYRIASASIAIDSTRIDGSLGLALSDDVTAFSDTDLEITALPTSLVERLVPNLKLPVQGSLSGHAAVRGPLTAMQVDLDMFLRPRGHASFRAVARGGVGVGAGEGDALTANALFVRGERVPLSLAREFDVDIPVGGVMTAEGTLSGSSKSRIRGSVRLTHVDRGATSRMVVQGVMSLADGVRMDVTAQVETLALTLANAFVDSLGIRGTASGRVHVTGTPRDINAQFALVLPDSGRLQGDASYRVGRGDTAQYRAEVVLGEVAPQSIMPSLPLMLVDGRVSLAGRGTDPATLAADLSSRLDLFMVDSAEFRSVVLEARARDGVLQLDSLSGATSFGSATASGTFGLSDAHDGTLRFAVQVDDLNGLRRWIGTSDTTLVPARPAVGLRVARLRERLDSLRLQARAQQDPAAELAASVRVASDTRRMSRPVQIPAIATDSTAGSFRVEGTATGDVKRADVAATLTTPGIVWGGALVGAGSARADWRGAFTKHDTIAVDAGVDSLRAAGFAFDSTRVRATYRRGEGDVQIALFPGDTSVYRLDAQYALRTNAGELRLRELELRLDSTVWRSSRASVISWGDDGLHVDSLELRDAASGGRIFVNGEIPDADPGRLDAIVERVRIAPWLAISQSDLAADGMLNANVMLTGTRAAPTLEGRVALTAATYGGSSFPDLSTTLAYAARSMRIDARVTGETGGELARVSGTVPLDLSFADSVATRLPDDKPLDVRIVGDSIPLSPFMELSDAVTDLQGRARSDVYVRGTWSKPSLSGSAALDMSQMRLAANGVLFKDVTARLRMSGDSVLVDTLSARSKGMLTGTGSIVFAPIANPHFNLAFRAADARVLDDATGELFADGEVQVRGALDSLRVGGAIAITRGVVYLPDPARRQVIDAEGPEVLAVADSATARELGLASAPNALLQNLQLDMTVDVRRGTFGRSPDANIEVFGKLRVRLDPPGDAFVITGALQTDQGIYTLFGKRFDVARGTVRFVGGEDLNPSLQIIAVYQVQQAGRAPLDIRVVIGGTLEAPTISLESDAQPTLPQSDLISFLAFGRSSSSLLQFSGTGLEGGGAGGSSLAGNVAALATRQLATLGVGALVDKLRADLATATRADILNITPAQLPADVSLGGLDVLLRGTEIEFGRYLNNRTFLLGRVRPSLTVPGASLEHRIGDRLSARGSVETRLQATPPSLSRGLTPRNLQVLGALLTWTFAW